MEQKKKFEGLYISKEQMQKDSIQVVTLEDLNQFGKALLGEIKYLLAQKQLPFESHWLKSVDVKRLLKISSGTLQHLRDTGRLRFTKVGGIIYYDYVHIKNLLQIF